MLDIVSLGCVIAYIITTINTEFNLNNKRLALIFIDILYFNILLIKQMHFNLAILVPWVRTKNVEPNS